jgi:uncharacterized protein (UPF0297 family)
MAINNPSLLKEVSELGALGLESFEAAKNSHVFAKRGFGDSKLGYYCSGFVLEYIGLFDEAAVMDPIVKFARPISEVPSKSLDPFVVFVALDDLIGAISHVKFMLEYVKRGLYSGGNLVLLANPLDEGPRKDANVYSEVSRCLTVVSEALQHSKSSLIDDFVCILFSQDPTSLRRAIRARTGPRRLEEMTMLFAARLTGRVSK